MDRRPRPDDTTQTGRPPGAVRRDEQGNAVWQWAASAGRQALDSTSRLLRKLEVPGLKLLDEDKPGDAPDGSPGAPGSPGVPSASAGRGKRRAAGGAARDPSGGYDPYGGRGASIAARASPNAKGAGPGVSAKRSWLGRLFGRR